MNNESAENDMYRYQQEGSVLDMIVFITEM